ncbi:MAG: hypothetical protein Q9214_003253 [Letrouitia sp. 1 TL-2023]
MGGGPPTPLEEHLLVLLPFPEPTAIFDRIRKNHPNVKITFRQILFTITPWNAATAVPPSLYNTATILVTLSALPPSPADCPHLKLIHFTSAGTNHVAQHPIYTDTDIPLTTSSGIHGPQMSEWVVMTALAHSHHYSLLHTWQQKHVWRNTGSSRELAFLRHLHDKVGQRLAVLGYGSIGRQVARVAKAMGADVIAYTARPRHTAEEKKDHGFIVPGTGDPEGEIPSAWYSGTDKASLHRFLAQDVDWLMVSVPLTPSTEKMLGKEEFEILARRNAFVTNISRGQIIDQPALIDALKAYADADPDPSPPVPAAADAAATGSTVGNGNTVEGFTSQTSEQLLTDHPLPGLRGAALDVADPEPLPPDDPLWDAPNCIITPHISGLGAAYVDRCFQVLEVNLERREKGEPLINVVDRQRGY